MQEKFIGVIREREKEREININNLRFFTNAKFSNERIEPLISSKPRGIKRKNREALIFEDLTRGMRESREIGLPRAMRQTQIYEAKSKFSARGPRGTWGVTHARTRS